MKVAVSQPSDELYMQQALAEAKIAYDLGEVPIGAVIVCQNRIIARAHNQTEMLNDVTAHAEMLAITSAANYLGAKYLHECELFVTVEPCPMCAGALYWAQVKRVVYAAPDEKRGYSVLNLKLLHPKTQVIGGVLGEQAQALMVSFFRSKRK